MPISWEVDIKNIKAKARACFFAKKKKKASLSLLWQVVCNEVSRVREACRFLTLKQFNKLPWNIKPAFMLLLEHGESYLTDSLYYAFHETLSNGKSLSLHLKSVSCFMKGKPHKRFEFGRNIQLEE